MKSQLSCHANRRIMAKELAFNGCDLSTFLPTKGGKIGLTGEVKVVLLVRSVAL